MQKNLKSAMRPTVAAVAFALSGIYAIAALGADVKVTLSGDQEVPAVKTAAAGSGTIMIGDDKSVGGSVTTTGVAATMAHIHMAGAGKNGPVIVPLTRMAIRLEGPRRREAQRRPDEGVQGRRTLRQRAQRGQSGRRDSRPAEALIRPEGSCGRRNAARLSGLDDGAIRRRFSMGNSESRHRR